MGAGGGGGGQGEGEGEGERGREICIYTYIHAHAHTHAPPTGVDESSIMNLSLYVLPKNSGISREAKTYEKLQQRALRVRIIAVRVRIIAVRVQ